MTSQPARKDAMTPTGPTPEVVPDSTPVQLTRMEGVLNLINHQLNEIIRRVDSHETRIGGLELNVQRLGDAAVADKLTVEQTARALKDAKEATEATARAELQKSDQAWSPLNRLLTAASILSALAAFYFALRPAG
jgi:hypothetical protein